MQFVVDAFRVFCDFVYTVVNIAGVAICGFIDTVVAIIAGVVFDGDFVSVYDSLVAAAVVGGGHGGGGGGDVCCGFICIVVGNIIAGVIFDGLIAVVVSCGDGGVGCVGFYVIVVVVVDVFVKVAVAIDVFGVIDVFYVFSAIVIVVHYLFVNY